MSPIVAIGNVEAIIVNGRNAVRATWYSPDVGGWVQTFADAYIVACEPNRIWLVSKGMPREVVDAMAKCAEEAFGTEESV